MTTPEVYLGNSGLIEVTGVSDASTGDFINNATVTATLYDSLEGAIDSVVDNKVSGETWPITLDYVADSDGNYSGGYSEAVAIEQNTFYYAAITVNAGTGRVGRWIIKVKGKVRS